MEKQRGERDVRGEGVFFKAAVQRRDVQTALLGQEGDTQRRGGNQTFSDGVTLLDDPRRSRWRRGTRRNHHKSLLEEEKKRQGGELRKGVSLEQLW